MPASLAGTEVDGAFTVTPDGRFVPDANAIRLFEYFLSTLGEIDETQIRQLIMAEIERRLPPSARAGAAAFLDQFLAYRDDAGEVTAQARAPGSLDSSIDALYALRRERFGAELAERLFGEDEALRTVALEQRQLRLDPKLSEQEREEAIRLAEADLPPEMREARERARISEEVARIRAESKSPEELRSKLTGVVGEDAALRLQELEQHRAEFQQRLTAFKAAREQLRARRLSPKALAQAEAALLNRVFPVAERARAAALTQRP